MLLDTTQLTDEMLEQVAGEACDVIVRRLGPRDEASFNRCYVTVLSAVANLAATSALAAGPGESAPSVDPSGSSSDAS